MNENHMVLPSADDGAISVDFCWTHEVEFDTYCPDCYLEERRKEMAREVTEGILDTIATITTSYKEIKDE